jgi:hypothetical protein
MHFRNVFFFLSGKLSSDRLRNSEIGLNDFESYSKASAN